MSQLAFKFLTTIAEIAPDYTEILTRYPVTCSPRRLRPFTEFIVYDEVPSVRIRDGYELSKGDLNKVEEILGWFEECYPNAIDLDEIPSHYLSRDLKFYQKEVKLALAVLRSCDFSYDDANQLIAASKLALEAYITELALLNRAEDIAEEDALSEG